MSHQDLTKELMNELKRISGLSIQQSEKSLLVAQALETYRKGRNRQTQEQQKKFMDYVTKFRAEKKAKEQDTNKKILEKVAGTELFQKFIEKFTKETKQ